MKLIETLALAGLLFLPLDGSTPVVKSIDAREIEFGLHVGSMAREESQKFLNSGPVLLPDGGLTLALIGLAYLGIGALRKSFS